MADNEYINSGYITKMGDNSTHNGSAGQPVDGTDFPHSGLIKALNAMATTGYAGLTASAGTGSKNFNMQMNDSSGLTVITVRTGKVIRGGVLQNATTEATITEIIDSGSMTDTSIQFQEVTADSAGANRYHLIVVDSSNVVKIRQSAGVDKVADLNSGDIPIAVLRMQRGEAKATRHIQYLTSSETAGTGITSADAIAAVEGEPTLDLTGDVTIAAGKDLTVDTNTLHVDASNNRVGIGTSSPSSELHVESASNPTIRVQETGQTGHTELTSVVDSQTRLKAINNTASEPITFDISPVSTATGTDQILRIFRDSQSAVDGNFRINRVGTTTSVLHVYSDKDGTDHKMTMDGKVGIGTTSPDTALHVKGDVTISRTADLSQTRILSIEGARNATGTNYAQIDLKNYDSHGPSSYVGARIAAINEATGVDDGSLVLSTANAGTLAERMRITDTGNVGIGKTNPSATLDVTGSIAATTSIDGDTIAATTSVTAPEVISNVFQKALGLEMLDAEVLDDSGQTFISGFKSMVYVNELASSVINAGPTPHALELPRANTAATTRLTIKNVNSGSVVSQNALTILPAPLVGDTIDFGQTDHPYVTSPNVITLAVGQSITLHAITDSGGAPIQTGWYVIGI